MKLSIIILNYNTAKVTLRCLKSINKYPLEDRFEVVLVDNGSIDESRKILKDFKTNNFVYKFIRNKTNTGFSRGNNIGLKKSSGEYKLLLNSDIEVTKDSLNKLMSAVLDYKDAGAFAPQLLNSDKTPQASVAHLPTIKGAIMQYWLGVKEAYEKYLPKSNSYSIVESAVMAAFLITPIGYEKVGMLDERYFIFFEDLEYCRQLKKYGLKIYYIPSSKVFHHHGHSGQNVAGESTQWMRLIPSSKIYHGKLRHYIIFLISWLGQKITKY